MRSRSRQRGFLSGIAMYVVIALGVALALSWAGAGIGFWFLDGKLEAANERATIATAALAKEEQSRKGFEAAAGACSASVGRLEARASAAEAAFAKRKGESEALTGVVQNHINAMLNRPRPEGLSICESMLKELDAEIEWRGKQ